MSHTNDLQSSMIKTSNDVQDSVSSANIKLLSFSCTNIKTSATFFQDFEKDIDIYLVQEHWHIFGTRTLTYIWYKNIDIFVKRSNDNSNKIEKDSKHRLQMLTYSTENQEQSMDDSITHQNCTF
jgi:hypothetical protein